MKEQSYYGHGKLLLSAEYFVLDGANALALPCKFGQVMNVRHTRSNNPKLVWKSYDSSGQLWFEASYELWRFRLLTEENQASLDLQMILRQARVQNVHFLREEADVHVDTSVEFPLEWGLGSSSSIIYNIAQWAYVSPFELSAKTFGGSGYDIACAQSMGPIVYSNDGGSPSWRSVNFSPFFKDKLYFVYLNQKQDSRKQVERYRSMELPDRQTLIKQINALTAGMAQAFDLQEFEAYMFEHEKLISRALDMPRVQDLNFKDYWGAIKSLGAWGGDFALATSDTSERETRRYFSERGFNTVLKYDEIICHKFLDQAESLPFLTERPHELEA
ncbi:MAG: GYDIA family GHMP kinase [Bacteriovoracaceae bacterium]